MTLLSSALPSPFVCLFRFFPPSPAVSFSLSAPFVSLGVALGAGLGACLGVLLAVFLGAGLEGAVLFLLPLGLPLFSLCPSGEVDAARFPDADISKNQICSADDWWEGRAGDNSTILPCQKKRGGGVCVIL